MRNLLGNSTCLFLLVSSALGLCGSRANLADERLLLVVGAPGEETYQAEFSQWADGWIDLCARQKWECTRIGDGQIDTEQTPLDTLREAIAAHRERKERLWIVLLGHGTYARATAKFNLDGPDVSADDLKNWLGPISADVIIVNCSSASAPFLTELGGPNRVVVTATRSGNEINFSRFGKYLSQAINDAEADIDHDKEVSLLEAFLSATSETEKFYREDARLATEHALLEDNGDRAGTSGDFYHGIRPAKQAEGGKSLDGAEAGRIIVFTPENAAAFPPQLAKQREDIESRLAALRQRKAEFKLSAYYDQLEALLLELAEVYAQAESAS